MAYKDGFLYAHTTPDANLYKIRATDGMVMWGPKKTYDLAGCDGTSSPIVAAGKVFVGHSCGPIEIDISGVGIEMARGGVQAFDTETGESACGLLHGSRGAVRPARWSGRRSASTSKPALSTPRPATTTA